MTHPIWTKNWQISESDDADDDGGDDEEEGDDVVTLNFINFSATWFHLNTCRLYVISQHTPFWPVTSWRTHTQVHTLLQMSLSSASSLSCPLSAQPQISSLVFLWASCLTVPTSYGFTVPPPFMSKPSQSGFSHHPSDIPVPDSIHALQHFHLCILQLLLSSPFTLIQHGILEKCVLLHLCSISDHLQKLPCTQVWNNQEHHLDRWRLNTD